MKYTYIGKIPTLLLVKGALRTYSYGDDVVLDRVPSKDFVIKQDTKVQKETKSKVERKPKDTP